MICLFRSFIAAAAPESPLATNHSLRLEIPLRTTLIARLRANHQLTADGQNSRRAPVLSVLRPTPCSLARPGAGAEGTPAGGDLRTR